jgi:hypothetical protein
MFSIVTTMADPARETLAITHRETLRLSRISDPAGYYLSILLHHLAITGHFDGRIENRQLVISRGLRKSLEKPESQFIDLHDHFTALI